MAPRATYRLQLTPDFGFDDAAAVVGYLADLGISHVYCSPYLQAAAGSTHGYDVVDHGRVSDDLGGPEAHRRFCDAVAEAGLRQVLDIVPNHMAITAGNRWWDDVLEHGQSSLYASWFDVDWNPPERKLRNVVLLPVLGDHYGRVVEAGQIRIERRGGSFVVVVYGEHTYPLAPQTYEAVLARAVARTDSEELDYISRSFANLPAATRTDQAAVVIRHRDTDVLKRALGRLLSEQPALADAVDEATVALTRNADALDAVLQRQSYRLAYWRTAVEELDYRRFFDVTGLAGLRVEREEVFDAVHALPLQWVADGTVDGLRIDHPDGLRDPTAYLDRLRQRVGSTWVVVEKILEPGESLPAQWHVDGSTGYDFLALADGVLVDAGGEAALTRAYAEHTGEPVDWDHITHEAKHAVLREVLAADLRRLGQLLVEVGESNRRYRDYTRSELEAALAEVLARFAVYRTYVRPGSGPSVEDEAQVNAALLATVRAGKADAELAGLLQDVLTGEVSGPGAELCLRFQQTSGPVMAKGVEDTAFYRFNRLLCRNEVGSDPSDFAVDPAAYQARLATVAQLGGQAMNATSTHDTKRSEDVRSRLAVLSEVPEDFAAAVVRWSAHNEQYRTEGWPDPNFEWALYQTLIGAHPLPVERALAWAEKATREAKQHTSWLAPVESYDTSVQAFVQGVVADEWFQDELGAFVETIAGAGRSNALALQVLKLTAPGAPDIYQGTEVWDLSLVDPDNRRPVDYDLRRKLLAELDGMAPAEIASRVDDGLAKLHVTRVALQLRAHHVEDFRGPYVPLDGDEHCLAARRGRDVVTVVTRLPVRLARSGGWEQRTVELPDGEWRDALTGRVHEGGRARLAELFEVFPVALLVRA